MRKIVSTEEYQGHVNSYDGLCTSCGEWTVGGVEPDAEGYLCALCDHPTVIGAEQALVMGVVDVEVTAAAAKAAAKAAAAKAAAAKAAAAKAAAAKAAAEAAAEAAADQRLREALRQACCAPPAARLPLALLAAAAEAAAEACEAAIDGDDTLLRRLIGSPVGEWPGLWAVRDP